ncbi:uncharacterized protein LOC132296626 [Cornus florida]|uniref:uncharacterized protein LOC132296626 n=1 Tax=Cornus florida TaxID=4283 RepID=UPI0028A210D7|nr:uncharacterized protein LOC132296626 [Cornus florida]
MDELNERSEGFVQLEEEEAANTRKATMVAVGGKTKVEMLIAKGEFANYVQGSAMEQNRPTEQDPLVICLLVTDCLVRRVLVDPGSSVNVITKVAFERLGIDSKKLKPTGNPLLGFDGKRVEPNGVVELPFFAAKRELTESFVVVDVHPSYNLLIGRGWIHRVQGVPSALHQLMRCLSPDGSEVIDIHGDQVAMKECYSMTLKASEKGKAVARPIDPLRPERTTKVGSKLTREEKQLLVEFLTKNANVFAWSHLNMPGVSPSVSCHSLNVYPNVRPIRLRQRRFAPERNQIIADKVDRLLEAGFIKEVHYPSWLSNVVVVQKKNGKWRVRIDFTNLNKACLKDSFPLPKIDQMVDATTGYERLTFLDAYSGYN